MSQESYTRTITLPDGREIIIEKGVLAHQATSAVTIRMGKAIMLATVVTEPQSMPLSFLPLTVNYKENLFAAGKIPSGFKKRQARLTDEEILKSRAIDRALRPFFPKDLNHTIQIEVHLLSHDKTIIPETLAILAASSALTASAIPFEGPLSSVHVARHNNQLYINPSPDLLEQADSSFIVGGTKDHLIMLEGSADNISEETLFEILDFAQKALTLQCVAQEDFAKSLPIPRPLAPSTVEKPSEEVMEKISTFIQDNLYVAFLEVAEKGYTTKTERKNAFKEAKERILAKFEDQTLLTEYETFLSELVSDTKRKVLRSLVLGKDLRVDGRKPDEIRAIKVIPDFLPSAHGSALFNRGETQILGVITLGSKQDASTLNGLDGDISRSFSPYYTFPSFAVGEAGPNRSPSRRELGHSNLTHLGLKSQLPPKSENPYTIDARAFTMTCDGSSSQGSISALSLALMDAGIKLKNQTTGVAIGLVFDQDTNQYKILSDIISDEDACGDIDLKVAGTKEGITGCQMDIKINCLPFEILKEMFARAKAGRLDILEKMDEAISAPRATLKPHTPIIQEITIDPKKIGSVIGPKGKVIQEIQQATGTTITVTDDGVVSVFSPDRASSEAALKEIERRVAEPTTGQNYEGVVTSITNYGIFVEFLPDKKGLVHVSEMEESHSEEIAASFKVGEKVDVLLLSTKFRDGRKQYNLSMKKSPQE